MDLIRLYYHSPNIMPEVLLRHFLRCIGFYTEEVSGTTKASEVVSIADIYMIDDAYVMEYGAQIDRLDEERAIVIFMDGWNIDDGVQGTKIEVESILYDEDISRQQFLYDILEALDAVMSRTISNKRLVYSVGNWLSALRQVADAYLGNEIMEITQYTKYFYKQDRLFDYAFEAYRNYIGELGKIYRKYEHAALLQYIDIYARYEMNFICKVNRYGYFTAPDTLLHVCENLLRKYDDNEELYLLRANIHFEFQDKWLQAWDEYQLEPVRHCSYVYYRCGWIARAYLKDYQQAFLILDRVVDMQPDYYRAWYQIAYCHELMGEYKKSIEGFLNVVTILKEKYQMHILSPQELEYLYKAVIKVALIYQNHLGDKLAAYEYNEVAGSVREDVERTAYLEVLWPKALEQPDLVADIKEEMYKHMNVQIQKMY